MKLTERKKMILINIVCVLALAVILWPLLVISKYNYPSADDWSYGVNTYRAIQNHEGVFQFLKTVYETVRNDTWEARFANIALASLQPGIFGEHCYAIVAYLMIGAIIFSEIYLAAVALFGNVESTTSYRAYRMWRNGWAQAYGKGWEERIAVLKDESVKNPVFPPLNYVELLMYTDLQPENGYVWVNSACAEYYGKESVTVTIGE